jgi:hypothetical protein
MLFYNTDTAKIQISTKLTELVQYKVDLNSKFGTRFQS